LYQFISYQPQLGLLKAKNPDIREFGLFLLCNLCKFSSSKLLNEGLLWRDLCLNGGINFLSEVANSKNVKQQQYAKKALDLLLHVSSRSNTCEIYSRKVHYESILDGRLLSDVTFSIEGKSIYAHKAILATNSPYFFSLFTNSLKEKNQDIFVIEDFSFNIFNQMIRYLYTKSLPDITPPIAEELLICSDMYLIEDLKCYLEEYLCQIVNDTNYMELRELAEQYNCFQLKITCYKSTINENTY